VRKLFASVILISLVTYALFASYPESKGMGRIITPEPGSVEAMLIEALKSTPDASWHEKYVDEASLNAFSLAYGEELLGILPLGSVIISESSEGVVHAKDTLSGVSITMFLTDEGRIRALSFSD